MADSKIFPHLEWTYEGPFAAAFGKTYLPNSEVKAAKADPKLHAGRLRGDLVSLRKMDETERERRAAEGLPEVKGKGFLLRVPEGTNVDALAHALQIELVAETTNGLMFAASDSLTLERLEQVLSAFEIGNLGEGGGNASSILEVFNGKDDPRKLSELLTQKVYALWPFKDKELYTLDIGIQTAASTRSFEWTRLPARRKQQTREEQAAMCAGLREKDRIRASELWMDAADQRVTELEAIVSHYGGEILTNCHTEAKERRSGIEFPDSVQVRVRMSGQGFRDLVECFPHLFEVAFPEDVRFLPGSPEAEGLEGDLEITAPPTDAATVCVIDSGIQEEHRWLAPAIDSKSSRCFLPSCEPDDVADYVQPRGHGTRVAGAVLYPQEVPKSGTIEPVAWIQNARVLDQSNHLPLELPPEQYLAEVVEHFHKGTRTTKLFNHSISEVGPCQTHRMCKWAAKLDDLSHHHDILFIQIAGNISAVDATASVMAGVQPPQHLLQGDAGIASPGQSLHALTVGSVAHTVIDEEGWRSFARNIGGPSAFTRIGYGPPWKAVKPDLVEFGGDRLHSVPPTRASRTARR